MKQRIISFVLLAALSFTSAAQLTYTFDAGRLTISGNGTTVEADKVNIALGRSSSEVENLTLSTLDITATGVTTIGAEAFRSCNLLGTITLPEGITSIESGAFRYCSWLGSFPFPSTLLSIGDYAFQNCGQLIWGTPPELTLSPNLKTLGKGAFSNCRISSIELPASLSSIGQYAFNNCSWLVTIKVAEASPYFSSVDGVLFDKEQKNLLAYPGGKGASYQVPSNVLSIGTAFSECVYLSEIRISDGVTTLDEGAFKNCSSLELVALPTSLQRIGKSAFQGCIMLASIDLNNQVQTLADSAFYGCSFLAKLALPASLTTIGACAFSECKSLTEITYLGAIEPTIGEKAFYVTDGLDARTLYVPRTLSGFTPANWGGGSVTTSIVYGEQKRLVYTFDATTGQLFITGSGDVIEASEINAALKRPTSSDPNTTLTQVKITASGVTAIGKEAFKYCKSLTAIILPVGVQTIGDSAFEGCGLLADVSLPIDLVGIGSLAFKNTPSLKSIALPAEVDVIGDYAFSESGLLSIALPEKVLSIGEGTFSLSTSLSAVFLPATLKAIGTSAFEGCVALAEITLPRSLEVLGDLAFSECVNLTTITLPSGLIELGTWSFYGCSSLTSIVLPASLTSIGEGVFYTCSALATITCFNGVEPFIGGDAFTEGLVPRILYVPNASSGFTAANWGADVTIKYGQQPVGIIAADGSLPFMAYAANGELSIQGLEYGTPYVVVQANGSVVALGIATSDNEVVSLLQRGTYLVQAYGKGVKVIY